MWHRSVLIRNAVCAVPVQWTIALFLLWPFPCLGSAHSFQFPRSPVFYFFYLHLFLLHVFSRNITPPQFRSSYLSVSTHFHVLITTSSSVFLSTRGNHLSLAPVIFSLMNSTPVLVSSLLVFSILFIPIIHLNILISVLSSRFCSAFLSAQVSLPYITAGRDHGAVCRL